MNSQIQQENIFDKLNAQKMTSLTINGAAIYDRVFKTQTTSVKTGGGSVSDLEVADTGGLSLLEQQTENPQYDAFFLHLVGVDHAGHEGGMKNVQIYNQTVSGLNQKL